MAERAGKASSRSPSFLDPVVAAAATHPTRVHAMTILNERSATAAEIGEEIGRSGQHVTYHLQQLCDLGLVEIVKTTPVHGGRVISHRYRATQRPLFDQASWEAMSETEQAGVTITILGVMSEDINRALAGGTINEPSGSDDGEEANHISRIPLALDVAGWNEVSKILEDALGRILAVQESSANRSGGSEDLILSKVHLLQFRSPDPH